MLSRYVRSQLVSTSLSFRFRGTGIDWHTLTSSNQGKAAVFIDGVLQATVDNYSAATAFGVVRSFGGFADAVHTLRIDVLGQKQDASTGTLVAVDRLVVQ